MRPDERELDEEIRSHLALSVRERIERGEDPEAARLAALREFGYVPAIRDQSAPGLGADNLTFSVPEIDDLKSRVTTISAFGEFSTIEFTMIGIGEPRVVQAGVVSGSFFDVMGLRPVLGRLLGAADDGPDAAGAAVLTHRFWTTALNRDPAVPCALARALRSWWECSSRRFRIRPIPRSSRTS